MSSVNNKQKRPFLCSHAVEEAAVVGTPHLLKSQGSHLLMMCNADNGQPKVAELHSQFELGTKPRARPADSQTYMMHAYHSA